jgi:hypothetical protein
MLTWLMLIWLCAGCCRAVQFAAGALVAEIEIEAAQL